MGDGGIRHMAIGIIPMAIGVGRVGPTIGNHVPGTQGILHSDLPGQLIRNSGRQS